jgi:putative transposase
MSLSSLPAHVVGGKTLTRPGSTNRGQAKGSTTPQVCKKLGVSEQTFYRWRTKYVALKEDETIRLKTPEQENARLKRIVAEQALDISMLRDVAKDAPIDRQVVSAA